MFATLTLLALVHCVINKNYIISNVYYVPDFELITLNTLTKFSPCNTTLRLVLLVSMFGHEEIKDWRNKVIHPRPTVNGRARIQTKLTGIKN